MQGGIFHRRTDKDESMGTSVEEKVALPFGSALNQLENRSTPKDAGVKFSLDKMRVSFQVQLRGERCGVRNRDEGTKRAEHCVTQTRCTPMRTKCSDQGCA